uniref:Uncharacterized protein n=1 Tax=Anopheles atroparvus TaxID=41427 RepID=A0AAG5CX66_ANOAO
MIVVWEVCSIHFPVSDGPLRGKLTKWKRKFGKM